MNFGKPIYVAPEIYQLRAIGARVTVLVGDDGALLVDTGAPGSFGAIASGLKSLGLSLGQVRWIYLTHYHPDHWSITGQGVPRADEPDRNVYIPGRNILLICPTAVWCSIQGIHRIALASLNENNFADATPEFFQSLGSALSNGLEHEIRLESPYIGLSKGELIARNSGLPLHLTLTCMVPVDGKHCGKCSKCHERHSAFVKAAIRDQTPYAVVPE